MQLDLGLFKSAVTGFSAHYCFGSRCARIASVMRAVPNVLLDEAVDWQLTSIVFSSVPRKKVMTPYPKHRTVMDDASSAVWIDQVPETGS